jgi:hypothetical protein
MEFAEPNGKRADLALDLLEEGRYVSFRGLGLHLEAAGSLECRVFTVWQPENVTEEIAREEFARGQVTLAALLDHSARFQQIASTKPRQWELLHHYGGGAIRVCRLTGDRLVWDDGYPRRT